MSDENSDTIDYTPLLSAVSLMDMYNYNKLTKRHLYVKDALVLALSVGVAAILFVVWLALMFAAYQGNSDRIISVGYVPGVKFTLLFGLVSGVIAFLIKCLSFGAFTREVKREIRFGRFISKNNNMSHKFFMYGINSKSSDILSHEKGLVFSKYVNRDSYDALIIKNEGITILNYNFSVDYAMSTDRFNYSVVIIELSRELPNIFIDSLSNESGILQQAAISSTYKKIQHLELEGGFDKYFNIYVPEKFETKALYIFTPELMQVMIARGHLFDFDIVGNKLYLYVPRAVIFNYDGLRFLIESARLFQAQFADNVKRYENDRIISPSSLKRDRKLQVLADLRWPIIVFLILLVIALLWLLLLKAVGPLIDYSVILLQVTG